jgi:hypothetical protein
VPWQRGHYYLFSKLLILNGAPAESGIFGLYRVHNRVFMAESADIRAALLRLHAAMDRFGFCHPTVFTFELCPAESRLRRLKQLLAAYRPICGETQPNIVVYG